MEFTRTIEKELLENCFKWKAIIIYGARQVGKTTLCKKLWWNHPNTLYVTGDDFSIVQFLTGISLVKLEQRLKGYRILIIDEAQKIKEIGNTIKLIVDNIPDIQVIATGSSAFDLANNIQESLTWRVKTFHLHPLSLEEIWAEVPIHQHKELLEQRLLYGMYPRSVITNDAQELFELVQSYAYKDVFLYESLRKPDLIVKLLQALALQIGSEVSFNELSQLLAVDVKTVQKYIGLLEQAFIIFRLPSFARNLRNELKRGQKIYFWDVGVRNGILRNVQAIASRTDIGHLWENFIVAERIKFLQNHRLPYHSFFWRTTSGSELDYLETDFGNFMASYEVKWSPKKHPKLPTSFQAEYPDASYHVITPDNAYSWVSN